MRFDELNLEDAILDGLEAMNFQEATPVQEQTIPVILAKKDIIACAQTGTGKTAAYVLPIINELSKGGFSENAVNAVIMAPTRELAQQIDQQIAGFTYFVPISAVAIYGGTDGVAWEQQRRGLEMGADIVIATPGRLLSYIKLGTVDLSQVSYLYLTKLIECLIWVSMTTSCKSTNNYLQLVRSSCFRRRCHRRSGHLQKQS